jgi:hypothetical protein
MPGLQALQGIPSFGGQLGQNLGGGLSQGIGTALSQMLQDKQISRREKEFTSRGLPPALARLGAVATVGGQTEIFKHALEEFRRNQDPNLQALQGLQEQQMQPQMQQGQQNAPQPQMQQQGSQEVPSANIAGGQVPQARQLAHADLGLTPTERVSREKERYGTNLPIYQETTAKLKTADKNKALIGILEKLDESDKLPTGIERLNVDSEGNLKLPFFSSAEAQRFVTTINEFSEGAKDTYGSRVTNFDLAQFMRRFPTLMNTKEGRRQIYEQMKIVNDINKEYYGALRDVYREAGGIRKIDADRAESIAEERSKAKVDQLYEKFQEIGKPPEEKFTVGQEFDKLPKASDMRGVTITLPSGEDIKSNGSKWIKTKK